MMELEDEIVNDDKDELAPGDRKVLAEMAFILHEAQTKNQPLSRMVFSLENRAQLSRCLGLLAAFPIAAGTINDLFVKAPGSGRQDVIKQFRDLCPNLVTYWGYINFISRSATDHLDAWMKMINGQQFDRYGLNGLADEEQVVLWSRKSGYQPSVNDTE